MEFVVYSKVGCTYCDRIKTVLTELNRKKEYPVSFYVLNKDFTKEEFYEKFGEGSTFPQVLYGEEKIGGCTDTIKYLMEHQMF